MRSTALYSVARLALTSVRTEGGLTVPVLLMGPQCEPCEPLLLAAAWWASWPCPAPGTRGSEAASSGWSAHFPGSLTVIWHKEVRRDRRWGWGQSRETEIPVKWRLKGQTHEGSPQWAPLPPQPGKKCCQLTASVTLTGPGPEGHYCTTALISHASKVMLKILQARLQQYVNRELPDVQAGFRKGRGTRD